MGGPGRRLRVRSRRDARRELGLGHVSHLWEETLSVPLIVKAPGLRPGRHTDSTFELTELGPLTLCLARGSVGESGEIPWHPPAKTTGIVAATYPPEAQELRVAVRGERYKLLSNGAGRYELYSPATDPLESEELYSRLQDEPEVAALRDTLEKTLAGISRSEFLDPDSLTEEQLRHLRALGYID